MRRFLAMAAITFMQGFRTQTFRIVALLFAALLAVSYFLKVLSVGHKDIMLRSFSLGAMEISGLLLIIFGCISGYYRERETRLQSIHLTFMSYFDHALGRLLGNCLLISAYIALSTLACSGILYMEEAWHVSFLFGAWSIMLKLCIICAFCALFSYMFTSPIFASLMTVFVNFAAEYAYFPLTMMKHIPTLVPNTVSRVFYHLLPNFDKIDLKYQAAHGTLPEAGYLLETTAYSGVYILVIFLLAWRVFSRHEH
ncbi:MAG: hypothetical protein ACOYXC_20005 [Candidatus Rifleibacteriota bacterium]